jgi:cytochrome c oxidase subunit 2
VPALAGCGKQSTLDPASPPARDIAQLWWVMLIGSALVFAVVTLLLIVAVLRGRARRAPEMEDTPGSRRLVLLGGFAIPLVVLCALFALTLSTLPATSAPRGRTDLTVLVIGRQWFWDVRYPGRKAVTANEIHIPAGRPVKLEVTSADVIHSFWVPRLNRKIDMIPGRVSSILLQADRPGSYRGQCAEFCGLQHANMAFLVMADPPDRFRAWLAAESKPARPPATDELRRGRDLFFSAGCSGCHTIRGTGAVGHIGPDLTHLAGRLTLAADTIPNGRGYLGGWILDPQHVKPGNRMPGLDLSGPDLQSLLDYLETLR